MHPLRLGERVPSCEPLSLASIAGYQLRFHKRGQDGSAKCNLFYTGNSQDRVYGVVFRMLSRERKRLDEAEGLGKGYNIHQVTVQAAAADCPVF
ncbi:MAG: gamma-glutamylcyclotransferase, partial [Gammaproteobacteria bacterium]